MTVPMVMSLRALWLGVCDLLDSVLPNESIDRSTSSCGQQQTQPSEQCRGWRATLGFCAWLRLLSGQCRW